MPRDLNDILQTHGEDAVRAHLDENRRLLEHFHPVGTSSTIVKSQPQTAIEAHGFVWRDPSTIPRREWLYPGLYVRQFVSATIAAGAVGKTGLCVAELISVVLGRDLLGIGRNFRVGSMMRGWYWNGEDGLLEMERQVHALMLHFGIQPDDLAGRLFLDSGRDMKIDLVRENPRGGFLINTDAKKQLVETIGQNVIDLAIFDPLANFATANVNSNEVMNAIVSTCGEIASACDCADPDWCITLASQVEPKSLQRMRAADRPLLLPRG